MLRLATVLLIFVPLLEASVRPVAAQTITLLPEATVESSNVTLGQVARISSPVEGQAEQVSKLAVQPAPAVGGFSTLPLADLRDRLTALGVNRAVWTLEGASSCRIFRIESAGSQIDRLQEQSLELRAGLSGPVVTVPEQSIPDNLAGCIRKLLADQYQPAGGSLVAHFDPADRALLILARPTYRFELAVRRASEQYVDVAVQVYVGEGGLGANRGSGKKDVETGGAGDGVTEVVAEGVTTTSGSAKDASDSDGQVATPVKTATVRVRVELSAPVVVAAKLINRSQVVTDDDVRVSLRPVGLTNSACRETAAVVGQQAKRVIRPDEIIAAADLTPLALVHRNKLVTVWSRQGGVLIKTVGRAMTDGAFRERVLVRNEVSRQAFYAIVTGPDTVELDPTPVQETKQSPRKTDVAAKAGD